MTVRELRLIPLLALLLVTACGGNGVEHKVETPKPVSPETSAPAGSLLKDSSGLPSGILLSWDPVADGVEEEIVGYHIYRSNEPIEDVQRGDSSLWLEDAEWGVDGEGNNTIYPTSLIPFGEQYEYIDLRSAELTLNLGETWYYRISAINDSGDEGLLSELVTVNVFQHSVQSLSTYNASVGDQIVIDGLFFGIFDESIDRVTFAGSLWNPDVVPPRMEDADVEAEIITWSPTQILVEVPDGATSGRLKVFVDSVSASPLQDFNCINPYITDITPYSRFSDEIFTIDGSNFGDGYGDENRVVLDGVDLGIADIYIIYNDVRISFTVPPGTSFGEHAVQVRNGTQVSNTGYIEVRNRPPVAEFSMDANSGQVPLSVEFNAGPSTDPDDGIAMWEFDFGDGETDSTTDDTDLIFNHVFNSVGVKEVMLTVTDNAGATDTISKFVTVTPAGDVFLIEDQFNGLGPGNEFSDNINALISDLQTLSVDFVNAPYAAGIGQVAQDHGYKAVIWNRGGPGPTDIVQDWTRSWNTDEKADLRAILEAGIPVLLVSQNHQFTADFTGQPGFSTRYGMNLQNDTVAESGPTRPFSWIFGTATDGIHEDGATGIEFPSSPVCLRPITSPPALVNIDNNSAEQYIGPGSSGLRPNACLIGTRIHGAIIYDSSTRGGITHNAFIPGLAFPDSDPDQHLCFSYGLAAAPDNNIGFAGSYSHTDGPTRLWVIGWSYSEANFAPDPITRHNVLHNILGWLDTSLVPPPTP